MHVRDLDTPALTVDLGAVQRNIKRMQDYCSRHDLALRPHIKTHKLPQIATMQLSAGATGITCQKLGEAEIMAAAGVEDIMISFPLVGPVKAARVTELARGGTISVAADSAEVAHALSDALSQERVEVGFLVDCDTGFGRTGVQTPDEALKLARLVGSLPGLRLAGLFTYPTTAASGPWLAEAREKIMAAGLAISRISGGGTETAFTTHEVGTVTEVRAGTYVYGDRSCIANGSVPIDDCALRVRSTVVSRPTPTRALLDAGSKTLTSDPAEGLGDGCYGLVVEYPEARIYGLSEEHGHVDLSECQTRPRIGEVITIIPNHACGTTNLHDEVVAHRRGTIAATWPIAARGKVR